MPSYYEQAVRGRIESWQAIRSRRAIAPAAAAGDRARRETFQSSLEQAEQQFTAASAVGFESRPLNLFYGLSQAGRAIACASPRLTGQDWRLLGHGIKCSNLMEPWTSVSQLIVRTMHDKNNVTSFGGVSRSLDSVDLPAGTVLGDILPLLFESNLRSPIGNLKYCPLITSTIPQVMQVGPTPYGRAHMTFELPASLLQTPTTDREPFADFQDRFFGLRSMSFAIPGLPTVNGWTGGDEVPLTWDLGAAPVAGQMLLPPGAVMYRRHVMLYPELPQTSGIFQPLMAWWAVLYALSMAARYAPAQWTRVINVDLSEEATAIEDILNTALDAVPELIDEALARS